MFNGLYYSLNIMIHQVSFASNLIFNQYQLFLGVDNVIKVDFLMQNSHIIYASELKKLGC